MNQEIIALRTGGRRVYRQTDGSYSFIAGLTIDVDGSPFAYHPQGRPPGLDHLANAGGPGHWWALACSPSGRPYVQEEHDPAPGYYVSTTSYQRPEFLLSDPRRYADAGTVPFIVLPAPWRVLIPEIVLGCSCEVELCTGGPVVPAAVLDFGPATHLGEGSAALARALHVEDDAVTGGLPGGVSYRVWPGRAAPGFALRPLHVSR